MSATNPKQKDENYDVGVMILILIALGLIFIFWHFNQHKILFGYLQFKLAEIAFFNYLLAPVDYLFSIFPARWFRVIQQGPTLRMGEVTSDHVHQLHALTMPWVCLFVGIIFLWFGGHLRRSITVRKFNRFRMRPPPRQSFLSRFAMLRPWFPLKKHDRHSHLYDFFRYQAEAWPAILPAMAEKIRNGDDPRWAWSHRPDSFLKSLGVELNLSGTPVMEIGKTDAGIPIYSESRADLAIRDAFNSQLKMPLRGSADMTPECQLLFAVFVLKFGKRTAEAEDLLARANRAWYDGIVVKKIIGRGVPLQNDMTEMDVVLSADQAMEGMGYTSILSDVRKVLQEPGVKKVERHFSARHAFVETLLCSMLDACREAAGVLPAAEFLWLRPSNRTLWYALVSVGGPCSHVEGAGIFAHWLVEKKFGRGFEKPQTANAWKDPGSNRFGLYAFVEDWKSVPERPPVGARLIDWFEEKLARNKLFNTARFEGGEDT